jgi:DNA-binding winged helix-turn-helix (wHTH) protein
MESGAEDYDLVFGEYRLESRSRGRRFRLFCGESTMPEKGAGPLTLAHLDYLAKRPHKIVLKREITAALWRDDPNGGGSVDKHISMLRKALKDNDPNHSDKPARFIETYRGTGYKFLCEPKMIPRPSDGASQGSEAFTSASRLYSEWDQRLFFDLLDEVESAGPRDGEDQGDLRILSSLFHDVMDLQLHKLLLKDRHIKIVVMNPANRALIRSRYKLRQDFELPGMLPERKALKDLRQQIAQLTALPRKVRAEKRDCRGTIEVRVSDLMPCGFLILTRNRALLGAMLADRSYVEGGPMIDVKPQDSTLWEMLNADWRARWEDAKRPSRQDLASLPTRSRR